MPSDQRPIIFLDIDGVLVNRRSLKERSGLRAVGDPACVAALNRLTGATNSIIVLSSSWRFCGLEEMRLILNHWGVGAPLVDLTPDLTRRADSSGLYQGAARGREIQAWMDENWKPKSFVILDDDCDMEHLGPYLVRTEFEPGLTMRDAERAIGIIQAAASRGQESTDGE